MQVADFIQTAFDESCREHFAIYEQWIDHACMLGEIAGVGHRINAQRNGELDLLLRQLDTEAVSAGDRDLCLYIRMAFSNIWVLSAYEMIRAADEQSTRKGKPDLKVKGLKYRLGLVRMPIAKGQIQGNNSKTSDIVLAYSNGSDPQQYNSDGNYFVSLATCATTGSAVWFPVDAQIKQNVIIRRIDLSDELLALFD